MVEVVDDVGGHGGGVVGDDFKFQLLLAAPDDLVADAGADEAVHHAEDHRLIAVIVDEKGDAGHDAVEGKDDPHQALLRVNVVNEGRHHVGAAGAGVLADNHAVNAAVDHAGGDGGQHGADAVIGGGVNPGGDVNDAPLQQQDAAGGAQGEQQRFHGVVPIQHEHGHQAQGHVDQQIHIAHGEAQLVLHHGGDAVEPRGGKGVGENEHHIVQRHDEAHGHHQKQLPGLFDTHIFHKASLLCLQTGGYYTPPFCKMQRMGLAFFRNDTIIMDEKREVTGKTATSLFHCRDGCPPGGGVR